MTQAQVAKAQAVPVAEATAGVIVEREGAGPRAEAPAGAEVLAGAGTTAGAGPLQHAHSREDGSTVPPNAATATNTANKTAAAEVSGQAAAAGGVGGLCADVAEHAAQHGAQQEGGVVAHVRPSGSSHHAGRDMAVEVTNGGTSNAGADTTATASATTATATAAADATAPVVVSIRDGAQQVLSATAAGMATAAAAQPPSTAAPAQPLHTAGAAGTAHVQSATASQHMPQGAVRTVPVLMDPAGAGADGASARGMPALDAASTANGTAGATAVLGIVQGPYGADGYDTEAPQLMTHDDNDGDGDDVIVAMDDAGNDLDDLLYSGDDTPGSTIITAVLQAVQHEDGLAGVHQLQLQLQCHDSAAGGTAGVTAEGRGAQQYSGTALGGDGTSPDGSGSSSGSYSGSGESGEGRSSNESMGDGLGSAGDPQHQQHLHQQALEQQAPTAEQGGAQAAGQAQTHGLAQATDAVHLQEQGQEAAAAGGGAGKAGRQSTPLPPPPDAPKYKGVSWAGDKGKWRAQISLGEKRKLHLG